MSVVARVRNSGIHFQSNLFRRGSGFILSIIASVHTSGVSARRELTVYVTGEIPGGGLPYESDGDALSFVAVLK